jgi:hypothetical protein
LQEARNRNCNQNDFKKQIIAMQLHAKEINRKQPNFAGKQTTQKVNKK